MSCALTLFILRYTLILTVVTNFPFLSVQAIAAEMPSELLHLQKAAHQDMQAKNYEEAREKYSSIIRKYPGTDSAVEARGKIVELWLQEGQRVKAAEAVESLMANSSNSKAFKDVLFSLVRYYRWGGKDPAKGREICTRWIDKFNDDPDAFKIQCMVVKSYLEEKNIEGAGKALERYKQLCKGKPDVSHETSHLADTLKSSGYLEQGNALSRWWFTDIYPNHEKTEKAYALLIDNYLQLNERDHAYAALEALMAKSSDQIDFKEAMQKAGRLYREIVKDPVTSRKIYMHWIEKFGNDPEAFKVQSSVVKTYLEENNPAGAIDALKIYKLLCMGKAVSADETLGLANAFRNAGCPEPSVDLCRWFTATFPSHEKAALMYFWQIDYLLKAKDRAQADAVLESLMAISSGSAAFREAIFRVGSTYRWNANDFAKGRDIYARWLEKFRSEPEAFKAQDMIVRSYLEEKNITEARKALEEYKELCKGKAEATAEIVNLAEAFRKAGCPEKSMELCRWFADTCPGYIKNDLMDVLLIDSHLQAKEQARADAALESFMAKCSDSAACKQALLRLGQAYEETAADPARSREIYGRWLEKFNRDTDAYKIQSAVVKTYLKEKNAAGAADALKTYKQFCAGKPDVYGETSSLAGEISKAGYPEESMGLCQWFSEAYPDHEKVFSMYAALIPIYFQQNNRAQADAALELMMLKSSNSQAFKDTLTWVGRTYRWTGKDPAKGREIYTRWLEKYRDDPEAFKFQCTVVKSHLEESDVEGANQALEQFKQLCVGKEDVFHEATHLADVYRWGGHPEKSIELYHWYVSLSSRHLDQLAKAYVDNRPFSKAMRDTLELSRNLKIRSEFLDGLVGQIKESRHPANLLSLYMGNCGGSVGKDVPGVLLQSIQSDKNPPSALMQIMDVCNREKMDALSVQLCKSYLAECPEDDHSPLLMLKLYESMLAGGGETTEVIGLLEEYIHKDPAQEPEQIARAITMKGQAYLQLAETASAMKCFEQVIDNYSNCKAASQSLFYIGNCYLVQNKFEQARKTFESLLQNYPGSEYEERARTLLINIRDLT